MTGLGEKVHIKFDNEETVAHERDAKDCVVFDMNPNPEDIEINMRVIAHWSSIVAYLSGTVIKIEGQKYYVHYDDGDKGWNNIRQIRILKPPTYFGMSDQRMFSFVRIMFVPIFLQHRQFFTNFCKVLIQWRPLGGRIPQITFA